MGGGIWRRLIFLSWPPSFLGLIPVVSACTCFKLRGFNVGADWRVNRTGNSICASLCNRFFPFSLSSSSDWKRKLQFNSKKSLPAEMRFDFFPPSRANHALPLSFNFIFFVASLPSTWRMRFPSAGGGSGQGGDLSPLFVPTTNKMKKITSAGQCNCDLLVLG